MRHSPIRKIDYLWVGQLFEWAFAIHYILWFTGSWMRHKRTEVMLPRLVREGRLRIARYGKQLVYAVPRISQGEYHIQHGLACTEGLVRFYRSDMSGTVIVSRLFRGLGCIPEWAIMYENTMLLYEYSSADQFSRGHKVEGKVVNYTAKMDRIEQRFGKTAWVLFVIEAPRPAVERWHARVRPTGRFLFTDYESFIQVPLGQQLSAAIYITEDGTVNPLRK